MTESNWTAWCKIHKCWVGPAAPATDWHKLHVHRPDTVPKKCDCPDETLDIRGTFEADPDYIQSA